MIYYPEIWKFAKTGNEVTILQQNKEFRNAIIPLHTIKGIKYRLNYTLVQNYINYGSITEAYEQYAIKMEQLCQEHK